MNITHDTLREMLVTPGHVSKEDFAAAEDEARTSGRSLEDVLVIGGRISDEQLGKVIADHFDMHFVSLRDASIEDEYLTYFPEVVARAQNAIVFKADADSLQLATSNLETYEFVSLLRKKTGRRIDVYYTTKRQLDEALKYYHGDLRERLRDLIAVAGEAHHEGIIIEIVDTIMGYASDNRASDIHIEPLGMDVQIRFRIDGILHEVMRYPSTLHDRIVFRIKIMSNLKTDEHGAAQDGRFGYARDGLAADVRVSILPVSDGENVVMRLLSAATHHYTLANIGLSKDDLKKVERAVDKPHGMILAVGPTGSGKSTALYTILERLNDPEVNIMTIEDPVEYAVIGVQQTQVNPKKNLTFGSGLRSIVRQDPDIIMVGEIRDEETADIAVNAAMTGHLLLSTLHTNDAATTFPRLMEMGVEPFLIASSINLIVAMRLVRIVCTHCKESYVPTKHELALLNLDETILAYLKEASGKDDLSSIRLYHGRGCRLCNDSGYEGRTGIFEVLEVTDTIRALVTRKETASVIEAEARKEGMLPLLQDGAAKVVAGVTTLEEMLKAART